jgi:parallel beta-helix repeat protein
MGQQTAIKAADGLMLKSPQGMLTNSNMGNYTASSGHNTGIVIHDLTIDGGTNVGCLIFRGADDTEIHSVRVVNFPHFGIDLRDGLNNNVHDNFADALHAPAPWHSLGGGVGRADGIFRGNKFNHNQAVNGVADFDSFDINGNQPMAVCEGNEMSENSSENTPIGIFLDSCAKTVANKNRVVGAANTGIVVTSGRRLAQQNTITESEIRQAGIGILLGNQANANVVTGNTINTTAKEAIVITDASRNQIRNNTLKGPGQSAPNSHPAIRITEAGPDYAAQNTIQGNQILDVKRAML